MTNTHDFHGKGDQVPSKFLSFAPRGPPETLVFTSVSDLIFSANTSFDTFRSLMI